VFACVAALNIAAQAINAVATCLIGVMHFSC
jgi:hypothetical protein